MDDNRDGVTTYYSHDVPKSGVAPIPFPTPPRSRSASGSRDAEAAAPWYYKLWSSFISSDGGCGGSDRCVSDADGDGDGGGDPSPPDSGCPEALTSTRCGELAMDGGAPSFDTSMFDAMCGCGGRRDADGATPQDVYVDDIVCGVVVGPAAADGQDDVCCDAAWRSDDAQSTGHDIASCDAAQRSATRNRRRRSDDALASQSPTRMKPHPQLYGVKVSRLQAEFPSWDDAAVVVDVLAMCDGELDHARAMMREMHKTTDPNKTTDLNREADAPSHHRNGSSSPHRTRSSTAASSTDVSFGEDGSDTEDGAGDDDKGGAVDDHDAAARARRASCETFGDEGGAGDDDDHDDDAGALYDEDDKAAIDRSIANYVEHGGDDDQSPSSPRSHCRHEPASREAPPAPAIP
jgi:hypothetical protein